MMDLVAGGLIGAVFSILLTLGWAWLVQLRTPVELYRTWYSTWQPTSLRDWSWVTEKVTIKKGLMGIRLSSSENSAGHRWQGHGKLVGNTYLIGEWRSVLPGSNAEGVFALTMTVEGNGMIGYFFTRDLDRKKVASGFVLGRSEGEMIEAKKKLIASRVRFPKDVA